GYEVSVVDPHVTELGDIQLVSLEEALQTAECVVLLVDHSEFASVDFRELIERLGSPRVIDTRGMWRDTH
ncbi:MAG: UDP-N-acetyl-D-mannosamine dehydrogenase, partial [Armatimonadetes bacterium]|nr:UDP-N-acetyl-D-mannosamine dehydrogenase [Armatimonadota bacterium]